MQGDDGLLRARKLYGLLHRLRRLPDGRDEAGVRRGRGRLLYLCFGPGVREPRVREAQLLRLREPSRRLRDGDAGRRLRRGGRGLFGLRGGDRLRGGQVPGHCLHRLHAAGWRLCRGDQRFSLRRGGRGLHRLRGVAALRKRQLRGTGRRQLRRRKSGLCLHQRLLRRRLQRPGGPLRNAHLRVPAERDHLRRSAAGLLQPSLRSRGQVRGPPVPRGRRRLFRPGDQLRGVLLSCVRTGWDVRETGLRTAGRRLRLRQ